MTTAYTDEELDALAELFEKTLPRVPFQSDLDALPQVAAMVSAGAPTGLIVKLLMESRQTVLLFFNPVVALQLMIGMHQSGTDNGWWKRDFEYQRDSGLLDPTPEEARTANDVTAFITASAGGVMLLYLARGAGSAQMVGLNEAVAAKLMLIIKTAGDKFGWWDDNLMLLPSDGASARIADLDVWRAAKQIIDQGHDDPKLVASQKADAAYELGDIFNFALWGRVANAIKELQRSKPDGEAVN